LADGERPATEVLGEATTLGIAEMTLRRARKALSVQVRRQGFGKDGRFLLVLPSNGTDPADGATRPNGNGNGFDHEDAQTGGATRILRLVAPVVARFGSVPNHGLKPQKQDDEGGKQRTPMLEGLWTCDQPLLFAPAS
jgi:hypothetical protein